MPNQSPIKDFVEKIFKDIDIPQEEKNTLVSIYLVAYYKTLLEALIVFNPQSEEFFKRMVDFFNQSINLLDGNKKPILQELMDKEQGKLLTFILSRYTAVLPVETLKKIQENLKG